MRDHILATKSLFSREILAEPIIRALMEQDGVEAGSVRKLLLSIATEEAQQ